MKPALGTRAIAGALRCCARASGETSGWPPMIMRDRRAGGQRARAPLGAAAWRPAAFGFALSRHRHALSRRRRSPCSTAGGDPADPAAAEAAARRLDSVATSTIRASARRTSRSAASVGCRDPGGARGASRAQRDFAHHPPPPAKGAVLDGRDIGTVVCPEADGEDFRHRQRGIPRLRRVKELRERGAAAIYERVLQDMRERDARDSGRAVAPLGAAADAIDSIRQRSMPSGVRGRRSTSSRGSSPRTLSGGCPCVSCRTGSSPPRPAGRRPFASAA